MRVKIKAASRYAYPNAEAVAESARQAVEHALKIRGFSEIEVSLQVEQEEKRGSDDARATGEN